MVRAPGVRYKIWIIPRVCLFTANSEKKRNCFIIMTSASECKAQLAWERAEQEACQWHKEEEFVREMADLELKEVEEQRVREEEEHRVREAEERQWQEEEEEWLVELAEQQQR